MMVINILKAKTEIIQESKNSLFEGLKEKEIWDPAGIAPSIEEAKDKGAKTHAKYLYLKNNPGAVWKNLGILLGVFALLFILFLTMNLYVANVILTILFFILLFITIHRLRKNQRKIVKLEVANDNNFLFLGERSYRRWQKYASMYPEVFSKGHESQRVEDCFWGETEVEGSKVKFVSGLFYFVTVSHGNKGERRRHPHWFHFFITKLPTKINSRFYLYPQTLLSKVGNLFSKKKIHTSSVQFNKTFSFKYKGKKSEKELDIMQILSPRVQEELLELNERKRKSLSFLKRRNSGINVLFSEDSVIFCCPGKVLRKVKTNFLKSPRIREEDKAYLNQEIEYMVKISKEVTKYLD